MATRNQLAVIHIWKKEMGLKDEAYRAALEAQCNGKRSAGDLSTEEARQFIDWMGKNGFHAKAKPTPRPASPREGRGAKSAPPLRGPSDGGETITVEQQGCIEAFRNFMKWDEKQMQKHSMKICKVWWPQSRAHGVKLIVNLIVINADAMLRNIRRLDKSQLTNWEKGFLYFNKPNALDEFSTYIANKNRRGHRTMPGCSMLKLLEILDKKPTSPLGVVPVEPANERED